ncbi:hypothetical protein [Homoserinimonas sp. OAct 916]|uniref:hypothetical protein n=1 Tax=Homoserinimonas sp. OAct 916 TaxID=2211450 RepID=UPI000DBE6CE2|nr:hypothetical protein [Homoserinimonas sp. OAct 916]
MNDECLVVLAQLISWGCTVELVEGVVRVRIPGGPAEVEQVRELVEPHETLLIEHFSPAAERKSS